MDVPKYDPNAILQAAENKRVQNDLEGAHMMFESALLEWVDDAREGAGDPDQMREAIATLWLAYADFHKSNKMVSKLPREREREGGRETIRRMCTGRNRRGNQTRQDPVKGPVQ